MGKKHAAPEPIVAPLVSKDVPYGKATSEYLPLPSMNDHVATNESKASMIVEDKKEAISQCALDKSPENVEYIKRDALLAKVKEDKREALVKAWENNEIEKFENKYQKTSTNIVAWEATKKFSSETKLKKEKLEKQKPTLVKRMKNEIATIDNKAVEKKAMVKATCGEAILKVAEYNVKYLAADQVQKKFLF